MPHHDSDDTNLDEKTTTEHDHEVQVDVLCAAAGPSTKEDATPGLITEPGPESAANQVARQDAKYSVFTKRQKWAIVVLVACAGLFSPLGANIYFPAIPTLAKAFHKTTQDINLTVTIYMVFQGITPSIWGSVADSYGRRPIYIACLGIFTVAQIGIALTPTSSYISLLILRCISAAGSAPVIALGAGTVGDIAVPAERGKYMGMVTSGPMLGPCIGPVFGGLLNQNLGWRSIFWFLTILAGSLLVPFILFFPETLRGLVGDGSIPAKGVNRTVWSVLSRRWKTRHEHHEHEHKVHEKTARKDVNPLIALRYILEKDVAIVLCYNALNYTAFYAVTTTMATIMENTYGLSTSKTGLCYLPIGVGMVFSTITSGRMLDRDFRATRAKMERKRAKDAEGAPEHHTGIEKAPQRPLDPNDLLDFPLEHARLRLQPIYSIMFWSSVIAYGWLVHFRAPLAVALVFQFIIGYSIVAVMQINQVILVDLYPGKGASVTANNNLCRCITGAIGTAVVDPMMHAVGTGWTMMIFIGFAAGSAPLICLEWKYGMHWRQERAARIKAEAAKASTSTPAPRLHVSDEKEKEKEDLPESPVEDDPEPRDVKKIPS